MGTKIWARYKGLDAEVIDETSKGSDSAGFLLQQYRMAYDSNWKIWAGRKKDEPQDT